MMVWIWALMSGLLITIGIKMWSQNIVMTMMLTFAVKAKALSRRPWNTAGRYSF